MTIIGLMPVRNEAWCLGLTARAALMWCDQLIVADHGSYDGSRDTMNAMHDEYGAGRFLIRDWRDHEWTEMAQRQMLLDEARDQGATHIALIDADEVLTGNLLPSIRGHVETAPPGTVLQLPWLQLRDGIANVMTSGMWGQSDACVSFQDDPAYHWKAQGPEAYDFHHRHPMGKPFRPHYVNRFHRGAGLMHLQFATRRRLLAKQALYQMTERLRWPDRPMANYIRTVRESEYADVSLAPESWWQPYSHLMPYLDVDAEPWQEPEVRRLIAEHGREKFRGLDLFGVA